MSVVKGNLKYIVALAALAILPRLGVAQIAVGVRYSTGAGSASYNVGEFTARVRALDRLYVAGIYQIIGGEWACTAGALDELRCGYNGGSISLGVGLPVLDNRHAYLAFGGGVGGFVRTWHGTLFRRAPSYCQCKRGR
jgi:hypothetical protein